MIAPTAFSNKKTSSGQENRWPHPYTAESVAHVRIGPGLSPVLLWFMERRGDLFLPQPKICSHGESNPRPKACYSDVLTTRLGTLSLVAGIRAVQ